MFFSGGNEILSNAVDKCLTNSREGLCDGPLGLLSEWNVSGVTDMEKMFDYTKWLRADLSKWDVSRVTTMRKMFLSARAFNADLSKWDVSRVTNMHSMFKNALAFNANLSEWDVSKTRIMDQMFFQALSFNQTLCGEAWGQSKASKSRMFCGSNGLISNCGGARSGNCFPFEF